MEHEKENTVHEQHNHAEHKTHKHEYSDYHPREKSKAYKMSTWILSGVCLLLLMGLILTLTLGNKSSTNGISISDAKTQTETYLKGMSQGQATVDSIEDKGDLYFVKITVSGQPYESYLTKDGKLLFPQGIDMTAPITETDANSGAQTPQANIQKTDKPKVELFVMSHCPYGTQAEKGIIPVINTLGNKVDFEIKFVNYAMHPTQGEVEEQLNQYCIQRDYRAKYLTYLGKFLEAGNSKEAFAAIGITQADISKCVAEIDAKFDVTKNLEDKASWSSGRFPKFMIYDADNKKYGVQGSPTLVINGVQSQAGRDAKSILNAICDAFITKPSECNTDMTSFGNPAPGFGFGTQGGSATAAGCGA